MSESVTTYRANFKNGLTIITPDWETMRQHVMSGDVTIVIISQSGEILYDTRDGWDIVTHEQDTRQAS